MRLGADVIGAIPHFEFTREYGVESLHKTFALAQKYDRLIDVHCDEIDDEQSRFVETVAALAHRDGMGGARDRQPYHGYALVQRRVCVTLVPPVENVGD
ncbi:cytosine deaminase [Salmonella enterica subsp. enterica]|uniref:Cytosine deaminase n=1 Tax=Salmonella enterica I TaxID=59201 RepID=A0A3S4F0P7_SALET|nr:cytosine deaminase [Salmonella enterica subsp. enterica]